MMYVPVETSPRLSFGDHLGAWAVRWSIGRMKFRVEPGLYSLGPVDDQSPVLVTANYKLSFDHVRSSLAGLAVWILVLDTKGVNVWCAAGKGTFGTDEIIRSIGATSLSGHVSHRELILPQLGAVGVSAPLVKAMSGFKVLYGPVQAKDISTYLANGKKKTPAMKEMPFGLADRLVLTPLELVQSARYAPFLLLAGLVLGLPLGQGYLDRSIAWSVALLGAWPLGAVLVPALLPWLPGKAFSLKGLFLALVYASFALMFLWFSLVPALQDRLIFALSGLAFLGAVLPLVVYTAMNFTGASTFTSQTGAVQEVKAALPLIKVCLIVAALALVAKIILGGIL